MWLCLKEEIIFELSLEEVGKLEDKSTISSFCWQWFVMHPSKKHLGGGTIIAKGIDVLLQTDNEPSVSLSSFSSKTEVISTKNAIEMRQIFA